MAARLIAFLACLFGGGATGWWFGHDRGAELGLVAGAVGWFVLESARAARALAWLKAADAKKDVRLGGLWGEAVDRARRAMRARDRELADAQARLDEFLSAIQASPNGVVLLDPQGRIEWCNETAAHQFGFDAARDLGQHIGNLVRDPAFAAYSQAGAYDHEVLIAGPGSSPSRPVKLSVQLHPYGEGRRLMLSRDVTAVQQAETMRRDFVANVSHEIRTPLTVLSGFVETLMSLPLPEEERMRYLGMMSQQAQRMQGLVSDLLTLSRLEGSPLPGGGEWTGAASLASQCEHEARGLADMLGKDLDLAFGAAPAVEISGASTELLSALSNLVSNAVRYTPSGGRVNVQWVALPGGALEFRVSDTGPGIAPEHIPRLTERFYRVDRSRSRETGGTGLGLAIVKHVVQRHGAELRIESTPGRGSTFAIQLPASRVRPALSAANTSARPATESAAG
jgi:two-component system phosphate regulon sensor histidine kinase PhoR